MQQGVRAVEAYRRAVLIDGVTSDNDSVAPVYKLEEVCTLLRTSSLDIVRELLERILKRLDHKSPVVKQKALRLIKFASGKAGVEFRREIQRQAPVVRNLLHYRGQPDALKGDALNKAVRETAQEALSAIFASTDKVSTEEMSKRMEGFGNTNFDSSTRDVKKSMLDDVIGYGSSTIRQMSGLASTASSGNYGSSNSGSYRGPNLRRSLTDRESKYHPSDSQGSTYSLSSHETFESRGSKTETSGGGSPREGRPVSQEDRLVDVITTPGGVRLQPSREAVQNFLTAAAKLDGDRLGYALQSKLQAHAWQVRLKAICVVEAILRQGDSNDVFQRVARMFEEDCGSIVENAQSPQASLKEKSKKVLDLLGVGSSEDSQSSGRLPPPPGSSSAVAPPKQPVVLPDLLDGWDEPEGTDSSQSNGTPSQHQEHATSASGGGAPSASTATDDLLGGFGWNDSVQQSTDTATREADLFGGFSANSANTPSSGNDLFSGLRVDTVETGVSNGTSDDSGLFEGLTFGGEDSTTSKKAQPAPDSLVDLFGGLSTEAPVKVNGASVDPFQGLSSAGSKPSLSNGANNNLQSLSGGNLSKQGIGNRQVNPSQVGSSLAGGALSSQMYTNPAVLMQMAGGTFQPNMVPQGFGPGPAAFLGMTPLQMQQQLAANLASMQALGIGMNFPTGASPLQGNGVSTSSFGQTYPDGFDFSNAAGPRYSTEPKKEETKAFDWLKLS